MFTDKKSLLNPVNSGKKRAKDVSFFANSFANSASVSQKRFCTSQKKSSKEASVHGLEYISFQKFSDMSLCKLFLDTRRVKKDGTFPVRLKVGGSSKLWLATGISVKPEDWDPEEERVTGKNARNLNIELTSFANMIKARLVVLMETRKWKTLSGAQQKAMLTDPEGYEMQQAQQTADISLGSFFERVVATKKSPRTQEIYQSTLKKLKEYCDPYAVSFDEITKMWVKGFESSLSDLAPNSVNIHLRNLRNVINCAIDEEITDRYPFRHYDMPKEATRKRSLDVEKFRRLLAVPNLRPGLEEYRDMFLLVFLLMGINMVDLAGLTQDNIRDGRLEYRRSKTGRLYSIKIEPEAAAIIKKYKGRDHLLAFADRYANHKDYAKRMNDGLKRLGEWRSRPLKERHRGVSSMEMVPIEPDLSAYWARHTWGTYAAELDIPYDTISEALGHEHTGSNTTLIYIKFRAEKIDEANRRVIDYLLGK